MLTNFGKFCRKLRIEKGEILFDMATKLGVSAAFLSKVENGKKMPLSEWGDIISVQYNLNLNERAYLRDIIFEERNKKSIDITSYSNTEKDMMLAFARKIDTLGDQKLNEIKRILSDN